MASTLRTLRSSSIIEMRLFLRVRTCGFSLVELLVVIAIIVVLLAVALPNLISTHSSAAETVVRREIQTIYQAQIQYLSQFGKYASALAELGRAAGPSAANLIPASLASGEKNGLSTRIGARSPRRQTILKSASKIVRQDQWPVPHNEC